MHSPPGGPASRAAAAVLFALVGVVAALSPASAQEDPQQEPPTEGTEGDEPEAPPARDLHAKTAAQLAAENAHVTLAAIGKSRGGRNLELLTILPLRDGSTVAATEIEWFGLVIAGLDGSRDPRERALALDVATELAAKAGDFPDSVAYQVLADANPDATAFRATGGVRAGNDQPTDEDQDGEVDEDGPDDVDGDGLLSWMRFPDPTGDLYVELDTRTELTPETPVWADPAKGKPRTHALVPEGRDSDDDFAWNEDGAGGVNLARNFTYGFEEHVPAAGRWAASEPETRAVMDHLLADERIALTYAFGAAETITKAPGATDAWPKPPDDDAALYAGLRELHGKGVEMERKARAPLPGSFGATAVHQLGRIHVSRAPLGQAGPPWPAQGAELPEWLEVMWLPLSGTGLPQDAEIGKIVAHPEKKAPGAWSEESDAAVAFLLEAARQRARLSFERTGVSGEPGVVKLRTRLVNSGRLPTHTERGAEVRGRRPINVWVRLPEGATLLAGKPHQQIERLAGGAASDEMRFVIQGPAGATVRIEAVTPDAGTTVLEVQIP